MSRRQHDELVPWRYVPRHTRKGWMTRDFCINGRPYIWLCNGASAEGITRHGVMAEELI